MNIHFLFPIPPFHLTLPTTYPTISYPILCTPLSFLYSQIIVERGWLLQPLYTTHISIQTHSLIQWRGATSGGTISLSAHNTNHSLFYTQTASIQTHSSYSYNHLTSSILLLSIQHFLFFHTTSFYQHSLFYNQSILLKLLYHHYSTPSILSLLLEYDDITEINLTHSSNTEWILNTLIELHTIYKSLIIVSCRWEEWNRSYHHINHSTRERRENGDELTHLPSQSDQRVVLNEHQWDSVWIETVQMEWVSSLSLNLVCSVSGWIVEESLTRILHWNDMRWCCERRRW